MGINNGRNRCGGPEGAASLFGEWADVTLEKSSFGE